MFLEYKIAINFDFKKFLTSAFFYGRTWILSLKLIQIIRFQV